MKSGKSNGGVGIVETLNCMRCKYRHEDNGNCAAVGGFCTAVPAAHCPLLRDFLDAGLTPEEVKRMSNILMDVGIDYNRSWEYVKNWLLDDRLRVLAEADKDGRLVVLPSNKTLTNADRMRTATNQQLAKLLYDNQKEFCRLMYKKLGFEDELNFSEDYSDILAWLNAPSNEAEAALEAMKDE